MEKFNNVTMTVEMMETATREKKVFSCVNSLIGGKDLCNHTRLKATLTSDTGVVLELGMALYFTDGGTTKEDYSRFATALSYEALLNNSSYGYEDNPWFSFSNFYFKIGTDLN